MWCRCQHRATSSSSGCCRSLHWGGPVAQLVGSTVAQGGQGASWLVVVVATSVVVARLVLVVRAGPVLVAMLELVGHWVA